jgi:hypothetical protein
MLSAMEVSICFLNCQATNVRINVVQWSCFLVQDMQVAHGTGRNKAFLSAKIGPTLHIKVA